LPALQADLLCAGGWLAPDRRLAGRKLPPQPSSHLIRLDPLQTPRENRVSGLEGFMPRISRLKAFVSIFALLPVLSLAVPPGPAAAPAKAAKFPKGAGDAASCRALAGRAIGPDMRIDTAEYDENSTTVGNTQVDVPLCRIVGVAYP